jgi:hypothetical protein
MGAILAQREPRQRCRQVVVPVRFQTIPIASGGAGR